MKRRDFSTGLTWAAAEGLPAVSGILGVSLGLLPWVHARAQSVTPVEGTDYIKLSQQQPLTPGKIDLIEFFWYGCPHCNAFEPALDEWAKKLPLDVAFRRVPVAFREEPFVPHQKIFYALEAMDLVTEMHRKVFAAIHIDHLRMDKPDEIAAFMAKNGVDAKKFLEAYNSFGVQTKAKQAVKLSDAFKIDGVPSLGVQGRYLTSGTLAGTPERSLAVADYLLDKVRKGA
jgi:thiol:disulfide interchange protein DsbA